MSTAIVTTLLGFLLTGLVGNRLLQSWQARNWLFQQRFSGREKEYVALKELADEIAGLLGVRIYYTQRLVKSFASLSDAKLLEREAEYEQAVKRWNERLTSFYVRLPLLASYDLAKSLESEIQALLVTISEKLDRLLAERSKGNPVSARSLAALDHELTSIQGRAINFNKEMLRRVVSSRTEVYDGKSLDFTRANLAHFSTWQLVKALFVRDIDSLSITRSPLDF